MKKFLITLVFILTIAFSSNMPAQASSTIVPDDNLRLAINEVLGEDSTHNPTPDEISTIESLSISGGDITSLEGLQYATNLTSLYANHNDISDFNPIKNLTQLKILQIDETKITDTTQLSNLVNLTELNLSANSLNEIDGVQNMTKLESLFAFNNNISDLSPLENCKALTSVDFINNEITDVSVFEDLPNLHTGRFAYNHISDISSFQHDISHAGNLNFEYQTVTLPPQDVSLAKKALMMANPIKGPVGQSISLENISNNGTYTNNELSWENLDSNTQQTTYNFEHFFSYNNYYMNFSGSVVQPLTWYPDNAPIIHGDDIVINQNSPFNPLEYITADDSEDGDVTNKIVIIENNVDTSILGKYDLIVSVTDSDGNTTTKTITVTVIGEQDNSTPTTDDSDSLPPSSTTVETKTTKEPLKVSDSQISTKSSTAKTEILPKTGDKTINNWMFLGGVFILSSILLLKTRKLKNLN
ncbi:DUF5011 domain-containing protein [Listeria monocytogenes]|uniref:leucine-rich repeat domain-containing protein n=1 Tax=Listeria seeligeri TaxID=1640 RepID=UPI0022EBB93C|nr:leucine-rich repeat domain-containing protein [Listeria seeligeri]EKT6042390.1 DUF5011 domain-containing protein [Listeria monocytogenes]EKT6045399.1 DUF5011 domain-containing protein [Listeria monocytogenes]